MQSVHFNIYNTTPPFCSSNSFRPQPLRLLGNPPSTSLGHDPTQVYIASYVSVPTSTATSTTIRTSSHSERLGPVVNATARRPNGLVCLWACLWLAFHVIYPTNTDADSRIFSPRNDNTPNIPLLQWLSLGASTSLMLSVRISLSLFSIVASTMHFYRPCATNLVVITRYLFVVF
jgi:hypothetical protein